MEEEIPFTVIAPIMKYLGTHLLRNVQNPHEGNLKAPLKEMKVALNNYTLHS